MPLPKLADHKLKIKKIFWPAIGVSLFLLLIIIVNWYSLVYFQDRFYPNTFIGSINLSGLSRQSATELINQRWNDLSQNGWTFQVNQHYSTIYPAISSAEGSPLLFSINLELTLNQAWGNRQTNKLKQSLSIINSWLVKQTNRAAISINESKIIEELDDNFKNIVSLGHPAEITITTDGQYQIKPEIIGQKIDYATGLRQLGLQLINLEQKPIELIIVPDNPTIKQADIGDLHEQITNYLDLTPITLTADKKSWNITKTELADWLSLEIIENQIGLIPSSDKLDQYLDKLAVDINQEPQPGQFKRTNNRLEQFKPGQDGRRLDIPASRTLITQSLLAGSSTIALIIEEIKNPLNDNDPATLGIIEILGTGTSDFSGSSANRIHNIQVGTDQVSGHLIAPNEEFSLIKTLGKINAATGYKPELVIKQNKTIPEYGGGLCQVATTIFRTALEAGLPITQRQNHSYRVSYYEPAGTDATIYDPWPDLRFINDTSHYILILGELNGRILSFSIWGTNDGRKVTKTEPTIYNIIRPAPRKLIETTDLPHGELKCTEKAHNGADAYFDYSVDYSNGETKTRRFKSHYVPWQEVCLIGKKIIIENETPTTTEQLITTTSTNSIIADNPDPITPNNTSTEPIQQ